MKRKLDIRTEGHNNGKKKMACFSVEPAQFKGKFPLFREPRELGSFSTDSKRTFLHDRSQLKYFIPPKQKNQISFNLREGYSCFVKRDESIQEYLNDLLKWIVKNRTQFKVSQTRPMPVFCLSTDFICWRGLLTKLACTPYENRDGWKIAVTLYNGTYYMCEFPTEDRLQQRETETERQKEMSYWGWKFEQYVTADSPSGTPNTPEPVNTNAGFCSVVRTRLNQHSLVFGGEVDCCEKINDSMKYIELKTSREFSHARQENSFKRYKLIKWWLQSFLIGIPKIICGFRDDDGVVRKLEPFDVGNIPRLCQGIPYSWDSTVCFNFLDRILQFIKENVQKDNPRVVYLFTFEPGNDVKYDECPPDSEYVFLPEWYYNSQVDVSLPERKYNSEVDDFLPKWYNNSEVENQADS